LADGQIYHIINRGNGRQQVFHADEDYRAFVELICRDLGLESTIKPMGRPRKWGQEK
jgi:hypothetical protein